MLVHSAALTAAMRRRLLASGLPLLACAAAWGDTSPYVIGVSETFSHDSNFVRLPDGANAPASLKAKADWIATTALFGGIDLPVGRQRFYANANIRDNRYRFNSTYNNQGFGLAGGFDWATVERLSGSLSLNSNRNLASFDRANGNNAPNIAKNIEQTDYVSATARIGVVTSLTLEAGLSHQKQRFSEFGARLQQSVASLGVRKRLGGALTVGAGLRLTNGRYPDYADSFKGRDIDLSASWIPSAISTVMARLSLGKTDHSLATALDYSGATGALSWEWKPSGKLAFTTHLTRSTGNDSSFERIGGFVAPVSARADNSRLTTTLGLNASYEASSKVRVDASISRAVRTLTNSLSINAEQPISATDGERLERLRLGARYAPTRTLELACNLSREARRADNSALTYAYHSKTIGCSAQFAVQP